MYASRRVIVVLGAVIAIGALGACDQKSDQAATTPGAATSEASQLLEPILASYETLRAELARDAVEAAVTSAGALQKVATDAASAAPERLRAPLSALATAAGKLEQTPKNDATSVRRTFGDVSKALVDLLAAEPSLRKGQHLFECPMAQGYKKWVQPSEKVANPYMGKQMLECGSESKWEGG